jgi:hypothetical protein
MIGPMSNGATWPAVKARTQVGVTTKQTALVSIVTIIETASLPPAFRVQTDADASVQGVAAATINPGPNSGPNTRAIGHARIGAKPKLTRLATIGAFGERRIRWIE